MSSSKAKTYDSVQRIFHAFADCTSSEFPHLQTYSKSIRFLTYPLVADILKSLKHTATYQPLTTFATPKPVTVQSCLSIRDTCTFRQCNPAYLSLCSLLDNLPTDTQLKISDYIDFTPVESSFDIPIFRRNIFYRSNILVSNLSPRNLFQKLILLLSSPFKSIRLNYHSVRAKSSASNQSREPLLLHAFSFKELLTPHEYKTLLLYIILFPSLLLEDFKLLNLHVIQARHLFNKDDFLITANGIQGCEVLTLASQTIGFRVHILQHGFGYQEVLNHTDIRYLVESTFADSFSSYIDHDSIPSFKLSYTRNFFHRRRKWISILPQPFSLYPGIELLTTTGLEYSSCYSCTQSILSTLMARYPEEQLNVRCPISSSIIDYTTPPELDKSSQMSLSQTLNNSKIVITVGVSTVLYESLLSSTPTIWIVPREVLKTLHPGLKRLALLMKKHSMLFDSAHTEALTDTIALDFSLLEKYHLMHQNLLSRFLNIYSPTKFIQRFHEVTL